MEFKVGDRVEFYFGDDKCEGVIKKVKPYGRYEITDDDYIFYDTSIDNITKITKEKKKTTLEQLEQRIEKLEKYVMGEQNTIEKSENVSNLKKNDLLTEDERVILRILYKKWKWIARNGIGWLFVHSSKPKKERGVWCSNDDENLIIFNHLFKFIQWDDEEPYNIEELLKGECGNE